MLRKAYNRRKRKIKIKYFVCVCCLLGIAFIYHTILSTSMRYRSDVSAEVLGYAKDNRSSTYNIVFNSNGGTGTMENQTIKYGDTASLSFNTFTNHENNFYGWNTKEDGSGISYEDGSSIKISSILEDNTLNLYAQWGKGIVEINGNYFNTVSEAIAANAIPKDKTKTKVNILANLSDKIIISKDMNVIIDLHGNTINNSTKEAIITNCGTLTVLNGTISTMSVATAAVNNEATGNITIDGTRILMEGNGGKQAFYNNKGIAEIKGNSYLFTLSSIRGAVQNLAGGTLKITEGNIVATNYHAVVNDGIMTIGIKDGEINRDSIIIQGKNNGILTTSKFDFYDGCIMGKEEALNDKTKIGEKEEGYGIIYSERIINNEKYACAFLSKAETIIFDPNGGLTSETERSIEDGGKIGTLPTCVRIGYTFDGWFTLIDGGEQITKDTVVTENRTFYAHWTPKEIAKVNNVIYSTLQDAITSVPDKTKTTITLMADTEEYVTIAERKDIVLDLQNHTISNFDAEHAIIVNRGKIEISNGTINTNAGNAAIDNERSANMKIVDLTINATGTRQAVYNNGGNLEITGNTVLTSTATGKPVSAQLERATVQNVNNGKVIIASGTITGVNQHGISNEGTLIIGIKGDKNIDKTTPVITGNIYGINSVGTLNIYDGVIKGIEDCVLGNITELEENTKQKNDIEIINGKTYKIMQLEIISQ